LKSFHLYATDSLRDHVDYSYRMFILYCVT